MGGHDDCRAILLELSDEIEHLGDEFRVERAGHLVEQQQFGVRCYCPYDCCALLLATGEPVGERFRLSGQPDAIQELHAPRLCDVFGNAEHVSGRERHVVEHAEVREQVVVLEDDADPRAHPIGIHRRFTDVLVAQPDLAVIDALQQVDRAQQR